MRALSTHAYLSPELPARTAARAGRVLGSSSSTRCARCRTSTRHGASAAVARSSSAPARLWRSAPVVGVIPSRVARAQERRNRVRHLHHSSRSPLSLRAPLSIAASTFMSPLSSISSPSRPRSTRCPHALGALTCLLLTRRRRPRRSPRRAASPVPCVPANLPAASWPLDIEAPAAALAARSILAACGHWRPGEIREGLTPAPYFWLLPTAHCCPLARGGACLCSQRSFLVGLGGGIFRIGAITRSPTSAVALVGLHASVVPTRPLALAGARSCGLL